MRVGCVCMHVRNPRVGCVCVHMDSVYNVRHVCVCVWFMIHPHVKKYASRLKQVTADT